MLALLAATGIHAQNHDTKGDNDLAKGLEITAQPGEVIGREQVVRYLVKCGTNQFLFILPLNARGGASADARRNSRETVRSSRRRHGA